MADFLRTLRRGSDVSPEAQQLVDRLEKQRAQLEPLIGDAARTIAQLQRLGSLGERVSQVERQLQGLEGIVLRVSSADTRLDQLADATSQLDERLDETARATEVVRAEAVDVREAQLQAVELRAEVAEFLALQGPFRQVEGETQMMRTHLEEFRAEITRMRDQQEQISRTHQVASSRLAAFDDERQMVIARVADAGEKVTQIERSMAEMAQMAETVTDTKRQHVNTKAQSEQLMLRLAELERQHEAIVRSGSRVEQVHNLLEQFEQGLAQQEAHADGMQRLENRLGELARRQQEVVSQSELLEKHQQELREAETTARREMLAMKESAERATERFSLESRSVETVSKRLADLRQALTDMEQRSVALEATAHAFASVTASSDGMVERQQHLAQELANLTERAAELRAGREEAERLVAQLGTLAQRVERVEHARPAIEEASVALASLGRTHEALAEGTEQLRRAQAEVSRTRSNLTETEAWLQTTQTAITSIEANVADLDRLRGTVEQVGSEVSRLTSGLADLEGRRTALEALHHRLDEATTLGTALDERTRGLQVRLQSSDARMADLTTQADSLGRISAQLTSLAAAAEQIDRRAAGVEGKVSTLEQRTEGAEEMGESLEQLRREVDARQASVAQAAAQLEKVAVLRAEAADAATALDEGSRRAEAALAHSAGRAAALDTLAADLEGRFVSLQHADEQMRRLEERLAQLRIVEERATQAMEQATGRQGTLDAMREEVRQLFELTERTAADARAVAEAQPQLDETSARMERLMARVQEVESGFRSLEDWRSQIDVAEQRLARADALAADARASLETLYTQKANLDHTIEKLGTLGIQSRQAEALIDVLREERRLTERVRSALHEAQES